MNTEYQISNIKIAEVPRRGNDFLNFAFGFLIFTFCLVAGCQSADKKASLVEQIGQLTQEKTQLQGQVEQSKTENEQLKEQIQVLSGLPEEVKLEKLYRLNSVKIGRYSGFYDDKDKDGKYERLIVYVQPIDEEGDKIKVTGTVDVELWNLNKAGDEALLGRWHVTPNELRKLWSATLLTINYRLVFDVAGKVHDFKDIMVAQVTFTDYLRGRVFKDQRIIKPRQE